MNEIGKELKEKIDNQQKSISTNEDISAYRYVKQGITSAGTQEWWSMEEKKKRNAITNPELNRKGGKHYEKHLLYNRTGLRGERNKIRIRNNYKYKQRKAELVAHGYNIMLHDEWIGDTAERRGVAFVDREMHQHGFIQIIQVMDGEITILKEK